MRHLRAMLAAVAERTLQPERTLVVAVQRVLPGEADAADAPGSTSHTRAPPPRSPATSPPRRRGRPARRPRRRTTPPSRRASGRARPRRSRRRASARSPGRRRSACRTARARTRRRSRARSPSTPMPTASSASAASRRRRTSSHSPGRRLGAVRRQPPEPERLVHRRDRLALRRRAVHLRHEHAADRARCGTNPSISIDHTSSPGWPRPRSARTARRRAPPELLEEHRSVEEREVVAAAGCRPSRARRAAPSSATGSPRGTRAPRGGDRPVPS